MDVLSKKEREHRRLVRLNHTQRDYDLLMMQPLVKLSFSETVDIWKNNIERLFEDRDDEPDPRRKAVIEKMLFNILYSPTAIKMRETARRMLAKQGYTEQKGSEAVQ
jgi:hypothetical protein